MFTFQKIRGLKLSKILTLACVLILLFSVSSYGATLNVSVNACKNQFGWCLNPLEDAEVYLNGRFIGITDILGILWEYDLRAGSYQVKVKKRGWVSQSKRFRATSNEFELVEFTLKRPQPARQERSYSASVEDSYDQPTARRSESKSQGVSYTSEEKEVPSQKQEPEPSQSLGQLILKYATAIFAILLVFVAVLALAFLALREERREELETVVQEREPDIQDPIDQIVDDISDLTGR